MNSAQQSVIDISAALERAGGNAELAQEIYRMLQRELPVYLETIPALFASGDLSSLADSIHKLHGSATYCGVPALKATVEFMESALKRNAVESYQDGLDNLLQEIRRLMEYPTLPL